MWSDHMVAEIDKFTGQVAGALGWGGSLVGMLVTARE
jgi:hypothetical protein